MKNALYLAILVAVGTFLTSCGGASGTGGGTITPAPTVSVTTTPGTINLGQSMTLTWTSNGTSVSITGPGLSLSSQPANGSAPITPTQTGTLTYSATATGPGGISQPATAQVIVNPGSAVTSVTVAGQSAVAATATAQFTATVQGTGNYNTALTWTASAGTISGTGLFTPPPTAQDGVTITATSVQTPTVGGTATVEVTRIITSFSPFEVDCGQQCPVANIPINGAGFTSTDALTINPYPSNSIGLTYASPTQLALQMGWDNNGGDWDVGSYVIAACASGGTHCSPNAYFNFGGSGGNLGGTNGTEELRLDPGGQQVLKYKLADMSSNGTVPGNIWGTAMAVDGNNVLINNLMEISVVNINNGSLINTSGLGRSPDQVAGKNGISSFTESTKGTVSFFAENVGGQPTIYPENAGQTPRALGMSTGCGGTNTFVFDEGKLQLFRFDAVQPNPLLGGLTITPQGNASLSTGFSTTSQLNLRRFVLASDAVCQSAVVAPYLTGGTNPDGSAAYAYAVALVDGTSMSPIEFVDAATQKPLGNFLTNALLSAKVERAVMAPDGTSIFVEVLDTDKGASNLIKIAWTSGSGSTVNVTVTDMGTVSPAGGFFGSSMVMDPNGKFIDLGMRQQPIVRVPLP